MMDAIAIVPAAGLGSRIGGDKALLDLGGKPALVRLTEQIQAAGICRLIVVRRRGAAAIPDLAGVQVVEVSGEGDMGDSLRAAHSALEAGIERIVVCPVDHALIAAETFAAVAASLEGENVSIALPLFRERPGHPVAMRRAVFAEIADPGTTLRDIVRRDADRVRAVPSANPWVHADLDRPEDLRAARAALRAEPHSVVEQIMRHRSHRAFSSEPLAEGQLERLVDAARYASTSSFIQAYATVCVTDPERKRQVATLCGGQTHIEQAPVFVAVCADLHKIAAACAQNGVELQSQSLELFLQATVDAALLGQNLALAAESEGLGICMIGAARNHPIELAELLELPRHVFAVFGMTVGHPTDDPVPRGRMPLDAVLHENVYDASEAKTASMLSGADEVMREWARRSNAEGGGYMGRPINEKKGWADRMAKMWGPDGGYMKARATLSDELRQLGFDIL